MRTRVVFNQKGGVGKSSITVNLAAISAHQGLKTLVIDLDPQANSSQYLLGDDATYSADKPALEPNIENYFEEVLGTQQSKGLLGNAIGSILKNRSKGLDSYVHQSPFKNLDVIPASPSLGALAYALESKHKIYKLRDALQQLSGKYERVFIDTPPAFNFFTLSALIAVWVLRSIASNRNEGLSEGCSFAIQAFKCSRDTCRRSGAMWSSVTFPFSRDA